MSWPIDDRLIDRLVDDELNAEDRRALLAELDSEPEGWRRCALAFLESQSWGRAFAAMPQAPPTLTVGTGATPGLAKTRRLPLALARLAAGFFLAFLLGLTVGGSSPWANPKGAPVGQATTSPVIPPQLDGPLDVSTEPSRDLVIEPANTSPPDNRSVTYDQAQGPAPRFAASATGAMPVRSLPEPIRRQWERRGFQIEEQHGLMAVQLKDGRRVAVPVEEVKFRYVGNRSL